MGRLPTGSVGGSAFRCDYPSSAATAVHFQSPQPPLMSRRNSLPPYLSSFSVPPGLTSPSPPSFSSSPLPKTHLDRLTPPNLMVDNQPPHAVGPYLSDEHDRLRQIAAAQRPRVGGRSNKAAASLHRWHRVGPRRRAARVGTTTTAAAAAAAANATGRGGGRGLSGNKRRTEAAPLVEGLRRRRRRGLGGRRRGAPPGGGAAYRCGASAGGNSRHPAGRVAVEGRDGQEGHSGYATTGGCDTPGEEMGQEGGLGVWEWENGEGRKHGTNSLTEAALFEGCTTKTDFGSPQCVGGWEADTSLASSPLRCEKL